MKRKTLFLALILFTMSYAYGVKVSPVRYDLSIARGSSQEFALNLLGSKGSYNQDLLIYPSDLFMSRSGALSFDSLIAGKNSCVKWIKMEKNKLSLLEDQNKKVKFKISIPANAIPGEYYAVIMVEPTKFTNVKDEKNPIMFQMKSRVAVVVVLDVPGRSYEKKGEITELKTLETDSLVKITSAFKNTGDMHLDVLGEAVVRSADGRINYGKCDLKALSSSKNEAFIFPGATRDFEGTLKRQLPAGDYVVEASYNYGYDFKKARQTEKFSIKREVSIDEEQTEFLRVNNSDLKLLVPKGARRTQVVAITNIDYRPININIETDEWIKILPNNFILKPGEVRNIMLTVSVSEYDESQKKVAVIFLKTDHGKDSTIKLCASGVKENLDTNK